MGQVAQKISPPQPTPSRMALTNVVSGRIQQPLRLILYGPPGIGKSTFAANAPTPIFLGAEDGTAQLDVARFPQPKTWQDVFDAIAVLGKEEHNYKTLVVDTLDWIEPLCHGFVANKLGVTDIDAIDYGRGYNVALDQYRLFISYLERLSTRRKMHIVLLAHSRISSFKNPEGPDFDRYEMKLNKKAGALLQEWATDVLFANYEMCTQTDRQKRVRGLDTGMRLIHTTRHAAFDAKNRSSLPESLPLNWEDYEDAVKTGRPADQDDIKVAIEALLDAVDEKTATKARNAMTKADGNSQKLSQILNRLKALTNDGGDNDTSG